MQCCGTCHWFERIQDKAGHCHTPLPYWMDDLPRELAGTVEGKG